MIFRNSSRRAFGAVVAAMALSLASFATNTRANTDAPLQEDAAVPVVPVPKSASLLIEPGLWRFTTNTFSAFAQPKPARTVTECIRDAELTPEAFAAEANGCSVHSVHADAESMSWRMRCVGETGSTMTGGASFTSTGTSLSGTLSMKMQIGEREADMKTIWDGERVGDCPSPSGPIFDDGSE